MASRGFRCPSCRTWFEGEGSRPRCPNCGARASEASVLGSSTRSQPEQPAPAGEGSSFDLGKWLSGSVGFIIFAVYVVLTILRS